MAEALRVLFDQPTWKVVFDVEPVVLTYEQVSESPAPEEYTPTVALAVAIDSGPRGRTGDRGPAGVVVIDADETVPPPDTPVGTVVYQLIN